MRVLITAGPTREYLDDVRFLSNGSSGRMGYALAQAAVERGWQIDLVTGPVAQPCPAGAAVYPVVSAREMHDRCIELLPQVDGIIAVAAVADYRPARRYPGKLEHGKQALAIELAPNPDILHDIGQRKTKQQWSVGFAVEPEASLERARNKLAAKNCDAIVVNRPAAMESEATHLFLLDRRGQLAFEYQGPKQTAAEQIIAWIAQHLVPHHGTS